VSLHNFNFSIGRSVSNLETLVSVANLATQFYSPPHIRNFMRISVGEIYPIYIEGAINFSM
jgi:hypothetical protein